jgi:hypothetical protein
MRTHEDATLKKWFPFWRPKPEARPLLDRPFAFLDTAWAPPSAWSWRAGWSG